MNDIPWESSLLERKVESDLKDLLKTIVSFANSVKPNEIATVLIGERDDRSVQGVTDPDKIQKKVRQECEKVYPPISYSIGLYTNSGKTCVKLEIRHDGETPHFGSPAWIRMGSETIKATEEQFQKLIELRLSKTRELTFWLNKWITVVGDLKSDPYPQLIWEWHGGEKEALIKEIKTHWVTFMKSGGEHVSVSLEKISISYDDRKHRLKVTVVY